MAHRRFGAFYARSFERRPWVTLAVANGTLGAIADTLAQTLERYQRATTTTTAADVAKEIKSATSSAASSSSSSSPASISAHSTLKTLEEKVEESGPLLSSSSSSSSSSPSSLPSWDVARTSRFFAFGVMMAPLLAEWNKFIEFRFPLRTAGGAAAGASSIAKVSMAALAKRVSVDQLGFAPFGLACFIGAMGFMEGRDVQGVKLKFEDMFMPALLANWKLWPAVQTINFRFMPLRYRVPFTGAVGIAWQVFLSILNSTKQKTSPQPQAIGT